MNYLIVADIRGFKYYIRIKSKFGVPAHKYDFAYEGLKNNATNHANKELAEAVIDGIKSPWELKVEAV